MLAFTRSVFDSESTDSLFKDIFTWHTTPERQTGFYISRNLQQQRLLTVVPPQGQTSTLRPLSTILFGLVHSHVLQWEKQGNQKEVGLCKKEEIKYLTFTSAQLSVRVCVCFISYRYWVCVVYLKLSRLVVVEVGPRGEEVEEHLQQVHVLPRHIWDLKNGTHPAEREGSHEEEEEEEESMAVN